MYSHTVTVHMVTGPQCRCKFHSHNAIRTQFESDSWSWHHHSQLDCDSRVQTTFENFGKSRLLRQSSSVFDWAWRIFGSYKQNQVGFDNLRASSVVLAGFLDHVNETKKKPLSNHLCRLVVWTNQRLQTWVRRSYCSQITAELLVWTGLLNCHSRTLPHNRILSACTQ